jgi:hypothetical protein
VFQRPGLASLGPPLNTAFGVLDMSYAYYSFEYPVITWAPPALTEIEQVVLGEEVLRLGRLQFTRRFLKQLLSLRPPPKAQPGWFLRLPSWARKLYALVVGGLLIAAVVAWPKILKPALGVMAFIALMWFGSMAVALIRHHFWLSRCVANYRAAKTKENLACPKCGQKLRLPRDKGRIQVSCPVCRLSFQYAT